MLTTERFFASFDKAGFLKPALWTPSTGLPGAGVQQSARVRFKAPTRDVLAGEADAEDYTITYPASVFPGIIRGEAVSVDGVAYLLREDPKLLLDGSAHVASLSKKTT